MQYRQKTYFNETDTYLFESVFRTFKSKVYQDVNVKTGEKDGRFWTIGGMEINAETLKCKKVN